MQVAASRLSAPEVPDDAEHREHRQGSEGHQRPSEAARQTRVLVPEEQAAAVGSGRLDEMSRGVVVGSVHDLLSSFAGVLSVDDDNGCLRCASRRTGRDPEHANVEQACDAGQAYGPGMRMLLTSGGITNSSIGDAFARLAGKPVEECRALVVPTAQWGHPACGPDGVRGLIAAGDSWRNLTGVGWASLGVLELTALPTIGAERWQQWVREADVLLVDGGDATYLCHWMRASGLLDFLPEAPDLVWVGVSAGSMVLTPRIGRQFASWPGADDDVTLGLVDFSIFPHLDLFATNTMEHAEAWAAEIGGPAYALDEQSAIVVDGDSIEVVSEGRWRRFEGRPPAS